ncbi:MAG: FkbM family methyltransferase [Geobacteraceae bacterium]|nr:FkbM family methyltransferase [Geobacteraceae bacterium]
MKNYPKNQERTADYLQKFDREKTIKYLIKERQPFILDVGANVGASLDEFKSWWPDANVHCFEPQKECWDALEQRAHKFPGTSVVINRCAVGSVPDEQATFYSHDINSGVSGFNKINLQSQDSIHLNRLIEVPQALQEYKRSLNHERSVKIIRLDDYLNKLGIDKINLLKIDTQGFEPQVFEGLGSRLSDVDVVITELMFFDYYERSLSFSDIERFLLPAGFYLYDISHISKNPMNGRTDWVDVIYIHKRLRSGIQNV